MISNLTLRNLKRLRCEKSIAEQFLGLVSNYLSNSPTRKDEINDDLFLLIELCNHHRQTLWSIYRDGATADQHDLKTWLYEIATPPSREWAELRLSLTPFIRAFGRLPRPRGSRLFSPMRDDLPETGSQDLESERIAEHELTIVEDGGSPDPTASTAAVDLTPSSMASYSITQGGMPGNPTYSMTSGSANRPGIDLAWPAATLSTSRMMDD
ncbi:MAG: hypothetical protein RLZZ214_2138 [Verrucomicrobiota bacterium]|jgi:hypothetical protein